MPENKEIGFYEDLKQKLDEWRMNHCIGKRDGESEGDFLERKSQLEIGVFFYNLALLDVTLLIGDFIAHLNSQGKSRADVEILEVVLKMVDAIKRR